MTGWDLVQAIEASVGYFWNVTRSQVYRELKTLAAEGYVSEKRAGARDKVPYAITAAGKSAFADWIAKEPGPDILRLPLVLTVFFGKEVPAEILRRHLEKARLQHASRLDEYLGIKANAEIEDPYQLSALELGIAFERTMLAWIEGLPWLRAKKAPSKRG